ncbi:unnamed protein product [Symbiodinium sp. CCMP2592]|nr:unnamed protein product [Symbiodinium sp. CCMP2592]
MVLSAMFLRRPACVPVLMLMLFAAPAAGSYDGALSQAATTAFGIVSQLQDSLTGGLVQDPVLAGVETIERSVQKASREGAQIQELLAQIKTALDVELSHLQFEESHAAARSELNVLDQRLQACRTGARADLHADGLQSQHKACRQAEAAAWTAFAEKCPADTLHLEGRRLLQGHADCPRLGRDYKQQRGACNRIQDELDSATCAQAHHKRVPCDLRLACEAKVLDAMNTALDTIEAQGREYFGLAKAKSSVACVLAGMGQPGETADDALKSCHKLDEESEVQAFMLSLPSLPQLSTCEPMAVLLQEEATGGVVDYSDLPHNAPAKTCSSACCSSLLQDDPVVNADDYEQAHDEKPPIALDGCVAWFRSEDAAVPWPSTIGSHEGQVVSRKADTSLEIGHGAKRGVRFLRGDEKTRFDFGEVLQETYSICSITRYTGKPYGRILQGSEGNWLHGHVAGKSGVSCEGQAMPSTGELDWVVVCSTSDDSRDALVNGDAVSQDSCQPANVKLKQNLVINHGKMWEDVSKWAVMEVIVWNRVVSVQEMKQASDYLNAKLADGVGVDLKISDADGACNGRRVQVQMSSKTGEGWYHYADSGDATDKRQYLLPDSSLGTYKVLESPLPIVSQRNPDELAPWGHSSLRGKAFVVMGNQKGPKMLSVFAIDNNLTIRISINGTDLKDVELEHGSASYIEGDFEYSRVLLMGTRNFILTMSGLDRTYSTPVAPAAKTIYGPCAEDWYVTSLKGTPVTIKQECSDGTSHEYTAGTVSWRMHDDARTSHYTNGPQVSNDALSKCETWTGSLAAAVKKCDDSASCLSLHDAFCDGREWRICSVTAETLKSVDAGATDACTKVKGASAASLIADTRSPAGWYRVDQSKKTCNATCSALSLVCSSDSSLLSSENKMKIAVGAVGGACSSVEDAQNGTLAATFRPDPNDAGTTICTPASESVPLDCGQEMPNDETVRICYCGSGVDELYKMASKGSNVCPDNYRAVESKEDCQAAAESDLAGIPPPIAWDAQDPNNQGSPSSCFKDLETGKVRFNSISMKGYEELDAWQTADHRKICKKAFEGPQEEPMCKFTATEDQTFLGGISYDRVTGSTASAITFMPPGVFQGETQMPFGISQIKLISDKNATCKIKGKKYKLHGQSGVFSLRLKDKNLSPLDVITCNQNIMAVGFKNMSGAVAEPRLNLLSATACQAANMRGVGGLQLDTVLHLEPGFVFVKVLEKSAKGEIYTIGKEEFNELLQPYNKYPVVKRICPSCAATHTEIVYRRFTPLKEYSPYESMSCAWNEDPDNVEGKDFKLFSDLNDAFADEHKWSACNFAPLDSFRGFPFESGPLLALGEQWDSIPVNAGDSTGKCTTDKGGRATAFYMLLPIVPQKFRLGLSVDQDGRITSLEETEFNRRFQESRYHIILRKCQECSKSHRYVFYRRMTNLDTYEPFKALACDWKADEANAYLVDFKLYSTLQDALADNNAWDYCAFDGNGFPGTCSPTGEAKSGQASYIPVSGCTGTSSKAVSFELYEDEDLDVDDLQDVEDAAGDAVRDVKDAALPSAIVPSEGMVSWFRSEDAGASWKSSVGPLTAEAKAGSIRTATRHYGAELKHVYGDSKSSFSFGDILPATFTMCSLSAYTGITQGKILRGESFWHGHADGQAGSVFYGGQWVRDEKNLTGTRSWIALCASNQHEYIFLDGVEVPAKFAGGGGNTAIGVNDGPEDEHSDWAVAEVMTWDRVLTRSEMNDVQNYLRAKAKTCQPEQSAQCDTAPCVSLFVGPNRHNVMFRNDDGTATVKTYSGTAITCVCKGHCVGLVGSWRCDDGPFGGQYTISPSYSDDWTPETNRDSLLLCTVARPVWSEKGEVDSKRFALQAGVSKELVKDTSFTLTATIRRDAAGGPQTLFSSSYDSSIVDKDLRAFVSADSTFTFHFGGQSCQTAPTEMSVAGEWQHLAFMYDMEQNETRIYLNALEVKSCAFTSSFSPDDSAKLVLGAYKDSNMWIGAMKESAIYAQTLSTPLIGRLAGDLALPKAMVWFSHEDSWNRKSFVEAVSFCAKRKMKLAHFEDYCTQNSDGVFTVRPRVAPGDQWAPYAGAQENSWVQIGNGASTKNPVEPCKTYEQQFGDKPKQLTPPTLRLRFPNPLSLHCLECCVPDKTLAMATLWEQGAADRQVVIDAGAAIRLKRLERFGGELFTTSGVYAEVRDEHARALLQTLPVELKVLEPRPEDSAAMGSEQSLPVAAFSLGDSPVQLAATVLFHVPSASKLRGSEPLDAYHTSIVVGQVEYSFSGQGIRETKPLVSHSMLKRNTEVRTIGHTPFSGYQMVALLNQFFQPATYDLLCKNCNSFSDCALYFLLGQRLEGKYCRMEKYGKTGQKRIGLMSGLRLLGMNYHPNPNSQSFQVEQVIQRIKAYKGPGHVELQDGHSPSEPCCCHLFF